jgi:hypothetical protein
MSILRASGNKARHDEDAIFATTSAALAEHSPDAAGSPRRDAVGF